MRKYNTRICSGENVIGEYQVKAPGHLIAVSRMQKYHIMGKGSLDVFASTLFSGLSRSN